MRGEVARSFAAGTGVLLDQLGTVTANNFVTWGNAPNSISIEGLTGCTAVVFLSEMGAAIFRLWEFPAFSCFENSSTNARFTTRLGSNAFGPAHS